MKHELLEPNKLYPVTGLTDNWKQQEKVKGGISLKIATNSNGVKIAELYDGQGRWFASRNVLNADREFDIKDEPKKVKNAKQALV